MPEALVEVVPLALFFLCFALVWTTRKLLAALFGVIIGAINSAHIPYLGGYLNDGLHAMEQAVDGALGSVEHGVDSLMGSSWHRFAQLNTWMWDEFKRHSLILAALAGPVGELAYAYIRIRSLAHDIGGRLTRETARTRRLEREYHGIEHKVRTLERDLSRGIGHDVLPRLRTLEREAAHIENVTLPAAIAAQRQADSAIADLYSWAKGKASLLGVGTFAVAVAAALDVLGLGGLRCPSFLRSLRTRGCGLFDGLEGMLGLFVDLFIVTDLCQVIPLLETAYADVAAPAVQALTEAIDAMPCVAGHQPPTMTTPRLHLPANPGFALSLP